MALFTPFPQHLAKAVDHCGVLEIPGISLNFAQLFSKILRKMVFFGFTWCPDVCPTTLSDISLWLEDLGADANRLIVALISVDPERDTPAVLADYVSSFDPRIIGLTGPADEVAKAVADFRVTYRRVDKDGGDYTMDHTAGVFLFHPDGRFASIIDFHEDRRFAVPKIRRTLS